MTLVHSFLRPMQYLSPISWLEGPMGLHSHIFHVGLTQQHVDRCTVCDKSIAAVAVHTSQHLEASSSSEYCVSLQHVPHRKHTGPDWLIPYVYWNNRCLPDTWNTQIQKKVAQNLSRNLNNQTHIALKHEICKMRHAGSAGTRHSEIHVHMTSQRERKGGSVPTRTDTHGEWGGFWYSTFVQMHAVPSTGYDC